MGVPGFFAWLVKKYPSEILHEKNDDIDILYLDWNGGIHPVCRSILQKYRGSHVSKDEIETEMVEEIINYLKYVVSYSPPKKLLYLAIDGVAPRAKMNQQRSRRFKSAKDRDIINNIRRKHKEQLDYQWDTNMITPGTKFMNNLCSIIKNTIKEDSFFNSTFEVIFSDANEPMEGEHKIVSHIRSNVKNEKCVIYGLDADLIFLSLLTNKCVWLMRERDQFGDVRGHKPFWYMDIITLKNKLLTEININLNCDLNPTIIVQDFVVYCFLLGNDFIPKLPCLFIHEGGIDELIKVYCTVINKMKIGITSSGSVDLNVISSMLQLLSETEGKRLQDYHKKNIHRIHYKPGSTPFEIELLEYDSIWPAPEDNVKLGKQGWKDRYYNHFFGIDRFKEKTSVNLMIFNYIKTIKWTWEYYNKGVPSWNWYYSYHHSPVLSDIAYFINNKKINIQFELSRPVQPIVQLLSVLPPQSFSLLDNRVENLLMAHPQLSKFYPHTFGEDCIHKKKRWQTIPNIPFINVELIEQFLMGMNL